MYDFGEAGSLVEVLRFDRRKAKCLTLVPGLDSISNGISNLFTSVGLPYLDQSSIVSTIQEAPPGLVHGVPQTDNDADPLAPGA